MELQNDPEMIAAFSEELQLIVNELTPVAESLRTNPNQPKLFEKFGQVIDRVYGTAATMGYKEIADYCRMMKSVTYKCSQSPNVYAQGQVRDLIMNAVQFMKKTQTIVQDPAQVKKIQYAMQKERERADELQRKLFNTIKRTSVA